MKCDNPEMLLILSLGNDTVPRVEGYDGMALEGSTLSFSCPPGLVITGPNSATCTGNGEWEPAPRGIMCNNMSSEGQCTINDA